MMFSSFVLSCEQNVIESLGCLIISRQTLVLLIHSVTSDDDNDDGHLLLFTSFSFSSVTLNVTFITILFFTILLFTFES